MADTFDPDDAFENGMWNSDAEPYDSGYGGTHYADPDPFAADPYATRQKGAHFADPDPYAKKQKGAHFANTDPYDTGQTGAQYPDYSMFNEDPTPPEPEPTPELRKRLWPWILAGALGVLLIASIIVTVSLVSSAQSIKTKAQTAMDYASTYLQATKRGDSATLQAAASGMSHVAHEVQNDLNEPLWSFASMLPIAGSDVQSVRSLSGVLVDVADNALIPLAQNSDVMQLSNLLSDGAINVNSVQALATALSETYPVIERSAQTIDELPPANLPQVASVLTSVKSKVGSAYALFKHVGPLVPYLPTLMGAGGQTKTYMVLAQNNAEVHACGGFVGAIGTLTVTDGNIELGDFDTVWKYLDESKIDAETNTVSAGATQEEIAIFTATVDTHHGDHNEVPDFSRVGQMYYNINQTINETAVDGVLAFDPVFLQYMLGVVGGVETSFDITVDGTNAAPLMLNETLFWWEPTVCDQFYDEVAKSAFSKILSNLGSADTSDFFSMVVKAADEGRCVAWVADPTIEAAIQQAGFGWELSHDETKPMTGVYVNDRSGTKSAYYLSLNPVVGEPTKNGDGSKSYPVTVTMRHNMSRDLITDEPLPAYIRVMATTNNNRSDVDLYEDMVLIAPQGGSIENITFERSNSVGGAPDPEMQWTSRGTLQGLQVMGSMVRIDAGETIVLNYTVTTSPNAQEDLVVRKTPVIPPEIGGWPE